MDPRVPDRPASGSLVRRSLRLVSPLALLLPWLLVRAERLPVKVFTIADGLPRDQVLRIRPGLRGDLWFCTVEGLSHFDGEVFTNYYVKEGLPAAWVRDVLETHSGAVWVATDGGLYEFDPRARRFTRLMVSDAGVGAGDAGGIYVLREDPAGRIWLGSETGVFWREDGTRGAAFHRVAIDPEKPSAPYRTSALVLDGTGTIWFNAGWDLCRRRKDGSIEHITQAQGLSVKSHPAAPIIALAVDDQGTVVGADEPVLPHVHPGGPFLQGVASSTWCVPRIVAVRDPTTREARRSAGAMPRSTTHPVNAHDVAGCAPSRER